MTTGGLADGYPGADDGGDGGDQDESAQQAADAAALKALEDAGFDGPVFHQVAGQWWNRGWLALMKWIPDNTIWARCRAAVPHGTERLPTRNRFFSQEDLYDLATEVLVHAVANFSRVLKRGGWDPAGSASLTSFFIGQVLIQFTARYPIWLTTRASAPADHTPIEEADQRPVSFRGDALSWTDPEAAVICADEIRTAMATAGSPLVGRIVALDFAGYQNAEIGRELDLGPRAVEGQLYRFRTEARRRRTSTGT